MDVSVLTCRALSWRIILVIFKFEAIIHVPLLLYILPAAVWTQSAQMKVSGLISLYLKGKPLAAMHIHRIWKEKTTMPLQTCLRKMVCGSKRKVLIRLCCVSVVSLCFQVTAVLCYSACCQSADTRSLYQVPQKHTSRSRAIKSMFPYLGSMFAHNSIGLKNGCDTIKSRANVDFGGAEADTDIRE